jgi:hypothetical protein
LSKCRRYLILRYRRSQQDYDKDELIFSIPHNHFHSIIEAIPHCTAGTAPFVEFGETV